MSASSRGPQLAIRWSTKLSFMMGLLAVLTAVCFGFLATGPSVEELAEEEPGKGFK